MKYVIITLDGAVMTTNSESTAMAYWEMYKCLVVNTEELTVIGLEHFTKEENV